MGQISGGRDRVGGVHPQIRGEFAMKAAKGRTPKKKRSDCKCGLCLDLKDLNAG